LIATAVLAVGLPAAPAAQAYKLGGKKWPTRTITYYAGGAPKYAKAIRRAVRAWNSSGVGIRFRATSRRHAHLRIYESPFASGRNASGLAVLGWLPPSTVTERYLDGAPLEIKGIPLPCGLRVPHQGHIVCRRGPYVSLQVPDGRRFPDVANQMAGVVAHELGHVLGLQHVRKGCAAMGPHGQTKCPKPPEPWQLRCRLLEADDVRGAIRRYGGKMSPLAPEFCDATPAPGTPSELVATFDPAERTVHVSWKNPTTAGVSVAQVAVEPGACPASFSDPLGLGAKPGRRKAANVSVGPNAGPRCVAVRAGDEFGRMSAPVTTVIDVTEAPPPECHSRCPD
jgi:hypothetical protein